ncbi:hypothetical protein BDW22DRAFT_1361203 [Trametopsis cervina]|nr:hypothetical protein BDW22DRAFT_1361203 [Trametopsis cervina]
MERVDFASWNDVCSNSVMLEYLSQCFLPNVMLLLYLEHVCMMLTSTLHDPSVTTNCSCTTRGMQTCRSRSESVSIRMIVQRRGGRGLFWSMFNMFHRPSSRTSTTARTHRSRDTTHHRPCIRPRIVARRRVGRLHIRRVCRRRGGHGGEDASASFQRPCAADHKLTPYVDHRCTAGDRAHLGSHLRYMDKNLRRSVPAAKRSVLQQIK